jgi:excisionase family DNA binding protein
MTAPEVRWLSTRDASARLGVTLRSLYRFIDEGELTAYKFGRVIRLKADDVDRYIEACRIQPGSLDHLYPARRGPDTDTSAGNDRADPDPDEEP